MKKSVHGQTMEALKRVIPEVVLQRGILMAIYLACGEGSVIAQDQDELYDACVKAVKENNSEGEVSFARIQELLYG